MTSKLTKYRLRAACLATILVAGVAPAIATAAGTTVHYRARGLAAGLASSSTSGSIETDVSLSATPGQGQGQGLFVFVSQIDLATGNSVSSYVGSVPLTNSQFQIGISLQSASLDVTGVVLTDLFTGNTATADISLTWTGSGGQPVGISRNDYRNRYLLPNGFVDIHSDYRGIARAATLVGSFVINGTDVLAGTLNFRDAYLQKSSTVEVCVTTAPGACNNFPF